MEIQEQVAALLLIFPLEIWLTIFQYAHPKRAKNVSSALPSFAKLLHPLRVKYLFPGVLKLLLPYFPKDTTYTFDGSKIFLKCRQVCRFWKTGADDFVQDPSHYICINGKELISGCLNLARLRTYLEDDDDESVENTPGHFENHFKESHLAIGKNPFISRCLTVTIPGPSDEYEQYFQKLEDVLKQCGHHVWNITIVSIDYFLGEDYPVARTLLGLLPNIKWLYIDHNLTTETDLWNPPALKPFPHMPNLEYLRVGEDDTRILEAVLENNRHLKVVHLDRNVDRDGSLVFVEDLPHLEELKVCVGRSNDFEIIRNGSMTWIDFEIIQNAQKAWHLKKLHLTLEKWHIIGTWFQILGRRFSATLNELMLTFPSEVGEMTNTWLLCLPQLGIILLDLPHPIHLDFILPMKDNLEYLLVGMSSRLPSTVVEFQEKSIIFFNEETDQDLAKSNIWQVFPKLAKVKYGRYETNTGLTGLVHFNKKWNTYKRFGPTQIKSHQTS